MSYIPSYNFSEDIDLMIVGLCDMVEERLENFSSNPKEEKEYLKQIICMVAECSVIDIISQIEVEMKTKMEAAKKNLQQAKENMPELDQDPYINGIQAAHDNNMYLLDETMKRYLAAPIDKMLTADYGITIEELHSYVSDDDNVNDNVNDDDNDNVNKKESDNGKENAVSVNATKEVERIMNSIKEELDKMEESLENDEPEN